ncbi:MAG: NAD(P)-dependent oxidoreductase [Clostridia bacterium]|nr:NAD(P)-dependent oxidoreductase [Clostridia bacterium]
MSKKTLAVIGLGNMGGGVAACLEGKGYTVYAYDLDAPKRNAFKNPCETAEQAAMNAEVILLSLPNSKVVEDTLHNMNKEAISNKVILDLSTSFPLSTKALCAEMKELGTVLLDAPLLAGPDEAKAGTLTTMVGGDQAAYEAMVPLIADFCTSYSYAGASGSAHTMKIVMNFTGLMYTVLLGQMFPIAEKAGLDPENLYNLMNTDVFSTWMYRFYVPKMIDRSFTEAFSLKLGLKDLKYMKDLCTAFGVPGFALDGGIELLERCVENGRGDKDFSECAAEMYELLGLSSKPAEKE